ncbi:hypothetical protein BDR03DRAFT_285777 [Suillus americanus]|nr:hypothetical protein BDR03DRAFT_285777 [Suillus americanus]
MAGTATCLVFNVNWMRLTLHLLIMPPVRVAVMLNFRRTENNAATTTSDLQWQPVIGIVAGFLSILLAVFLLYLLFQFHASGVPHRVFGYVLPSGTRRVSHSVTGNERSGSRPDLSSPAPPPPYTARLTAASLYTNLTVPPRSLQGRPVHYPGNYPPPRRHVDEPISRG